MIFRMMTPHDIEAVSNLAGELGYPNKPESIAKRFTEISSHKDHAIIVADDDNAKVIGWMHLQVHLSLVTDPRVEIAGLVVSEQYRGQGIGQKFVDEAERWAELNGFNQLRLSSNIQRTDAHRFYHRLGFDNKKTSHIFTKSL